PDGRWQCRRGPAPAQGFRRRRPEAREDQASARLRLVALRLALVGVGFCLLLGPAGRCLCRLRRALGLLPARLGLGLAGGAVVAAGVLAALELALGRRVALRPWLAVGF